MDKQQTVASIFNVYGHQESFIRNGFIVLRNFLHEQEILVTQSETETVIASATELRKERRQRHNTKLGASR